MSNGDIETYQAGGLWHNRIVGERYVLSSHLVKQDAENAGRALAECHDVRHIVRTLLGRVAAELQDEQGRMAASS